MARYRLTSPARTLPDDVDPADVERDRLLVAGLLKRAARARHDPSAFFSFVMREEHGRADEAPAAERFAEALRTGGGPTDDAPAGPVRRRLSATAHQRVLLDFVEAHDRCVLRLPAGASKTYCVGSEILRALGNDPTERGAVISATQGAAKRPLALVRDYVENRRDFPELGLVFPELRPSDRVGDPWTQEALTVRRPPGIRDPSLVAVGMDAGSLPGSRLSWIFVDDLVNETNTRTEEQRKKVISWFLSTVLSRDDVGRAKIVVANTPWHPKDLTYALEESGWPTLTMDVEGFVWVSNTDWDSDEVRPAFGRAGDPKTPHKGHYLRLAAHDAGAYEAHGARVCDVAPDWSAEPVGPENDNAGPASGTRARFFDDRELVPLWPEKWPRSWIEATRQAYAAQLYRFNQLYMCVCVDEDDARCKSEWIERCKDAAAREGITSLVAQYDGPNLVVTGVDLAIGQKKKHALTFLFTYESRPDGKRRLLDVEFGRFKGREIVRKIRQKSRSYRSLVRVENNGGQDFLRQWAVEDNDREPLPIRAHWTTSGGKAHPTFGIESIFVAMEAGVWLIPNESGRVDPRVAKWLSDCLAYQPPPAHTPDSLMSCWLATEQEREITKGRPGGAGGGPIAAGLFVR